MKKKRANKNMIIQFKRNNSEIVRNSFSGLDR